MASDHGIALSTWPFWGDFPIGPQPDGGTATLQTWNWWGGYLPDGPPFVDAYTPYYPPIEPYVLPRANFEGIIGAYGIDLTWRKSHGCPCVWNGPTIGTADPACLTCLGRGYYWDQPSANFKGLITFIHMSPTPDEPGSMMDPTHGLTNNADPALTITYRNPDVWNGASEFDLFCETASISRYNATLAVGRRTNLVYPQQLNVATTGAVSIYNTVTKKVEHPNTYSVVGTQVILTGYPKGTPYMVEFTAAPTYVAFRIAGSLPHIRPFGDVKLPRRFRLQSLDLWLRAQSAGDV